MMHLNQRQILFLANAILAMSECNLVKAYEILVGHIVSGYLSFGISGNQENSSTIQVSPSISSFTQSGSESKVSNSKSSSFSTESEKVTFKSSGSSSLSGNDGDDFDPTIGTKKWEKWVCPDPDEIISNPEFWAKLKEESETCLIDEEIQKENKDSSKEMEIESTPKRSRRRRLLSVPNPPLVAKPTPTGRLDQQKIELK